jgi:hypothetical protein
VRAIIAAAGLCARLELRKRRLVNDALAIYGRIVIIVELWVEMDDVLETLVVKDPSGGLLARVVPPGLWRFDVSRGTRSFRPGEKVRSWF